MTKDIGRENSKRGRLFEEKYYDAFCGYPVTKRCTVSRHAGMAASDTRRHFRKKRVGEITEVEATETRCKLQRFVRERIEDPADIAFRTDRGECHGVSLKYGGHSVTIKQPGLKSLYDSFGANTEYLYETLTSHAGEIERITSGEIDPSLSKARKHKIFKSLIRDDSPVVGVARRKNKEYREAIARDLGEAFSRLSFDDKSDALRALFNISSGDVIKTIVVHFNVKKEETKITDPYEYFDELSSQTRDVICEVAGTLMKFYCVLEGGGRYHFLTCQIKNRSGSPFTSILGNVRRGSRRDFKESEDE